MTSPIRANWLSPLPMTPIIVAMRAPLLSATSSLDRIWTIKLFLDDLHQAPSFQFAERTRLHDADRVARLGFVLLIVRIEFLFLLHDFAELGVRDARHGADD